MYGYFPNNYRCEKVSDLCDGHNVQTGECFSCKPGIILENGKCADKNCQETLYGKCVNCMAGFKKNDDGICEYNDPLCLESFNSRCEQCKSGYYVNIEGKCMKLPPNCKIANFQTGDCLECETGFDFHPSKGCTAAVKIENCNVPDPAKEGHCLVC